MNRTEYSTKIIRKNIIFFGRVQGVGFRYRAHYAAEMYGVTGWVHNRYDGSVELEAEGTEQSIDNMLLAIDKGTYISIEEMKVRTIPVEGSTWVEIK